MASPQQRLKTETIRSPRRRGEASKRTAVASPYNKENELNEQNKIPLQNQKRIGKKTESLLHERKERYKREKALREKAAQIRQRLEGQSPTPIVRTALSIRPAPTKPPLFSSSPETSAAVPEQKPPAKELQYLANKEIYGILARYEKERAKGKAPSKSNDTEEPTKQRTKQVQASLPLPAPEFNKIALAAVHICSECDANLKCIGSCSCSHALPQTSAEEEPEIERMEMPTITTTVLPATFATSEERKEMAVRHELVLPVPTWKMLGKQACNLF